MFVSFEKTRQEIAAKSKKFRLQKGLNSLSQGKATYSGEIS